MPDRTDRELLTIFNSGTDAEMAALSPSEQDRLLSLVQPSAPAESPISRFLGGVARNLNPLAAAEFVRAVATPLRPESRAALMGGVIDPSVAQLTQAGEAYQQGRPGAALGHAAAAIPLIGPAVGSAVERLRAGDVAGGLGEVTGLAAPFVAGPVVGGLRGATTAALRGTRLGTAIATWAEGAAANRLAQVAGPKVGPQKVALTNKLVTHAPEVLRDPDLGAYSVEGLATKIERRAQEAATALDAAADARLTTRTFQTAPILADLQHQRARWVAETVQTKPLGRDVVPAPNATKVALLDQMIADVKALGPAAQYEPLRRIREAYDAIAKRKYYPDVAKDFLTQTGEATAASQGTGVLRSHLAKFEPETAKANAAYSLYTAVDDVLQAARESERARPKVGRTLMSGLAGTVAGAATGSPMTAGIGAIVGVMAERAVSLGPTFQIQIARSLQAIADALRRGDLPTAQALVTRTTARFPAGKTTLKVTPLAGRFEAKAPEE